MEEDRTRGRGWMADGRNAPAILHGQLGAQLMLQPGTTNLLLRGACQVVGVVYPVYASVKALEYDDEEEKKQWLTYWTAYGCFAVLENYSDKFMRGLPMYQHLKLATLLWLQLPPFHGSKSIHEKIIRPFLIKHRSRIDEVVETFRSELVQFSMKHHSDISRACNASRRFLVQVVQKSFLVLKDMFEVEDGEGDI
eukprot:scaffold1052_cov339-Pavlova_lutheri.AAC.5